MILNNKATKTLLLTIATMYQEKRDELAKLDSYIGDGDHGISMARGAKAAFEAISNMDDNQPISEYFKVYGRTLVAEIGGAIGPLFGIMFTEFGKCTKGLDVITPEAFVQSITNSSKKVMEFGGAKPNDKTMVDAMIPSVQSATKALDDNQDFEAVLMQAKDGAYAGVMATIPMKAMRGRSKFLQEKSIGHQDAGATSYYYLLNRIYEYYLGDVDYIKITDDVSDTQKEVSSEISNDVQIQKFINSPYDIVEETVNGYAKAYKDNLRKVEGSNVLARKEQTKGKVGVIIGNGSGHEPACLGFVGENCLDANAYGGIFASPGPYAIFDAIKEADTGNGVCVLISSHAGDILNAKMAIDMAEDEGITARGVLLYDDVASAPKTQPLSERRGSIGTLFSYKIVGSYSSDNKSLNEICEMAERVRDNTRSIASAMLPGTSPITGEPMFESSPGTVLVGLGVHGEAALYTYKNKTCKEIAYGMAKALIEDKPYQEGDTVSVVVNSAGQTSMMELMIYYSAIEEYLSSKGIKIFHPLIGRYITTQEMGGIGLAICKMDEEMQANWIKPTNAPHFSVL